MVSKKKSVRNKTSQTDLNEINESLDNIKQSIEDLASSIPSAENFEISQLRHEQILSANQDSIQRTLEQNDIHHKENLKHQNEFNEKQIEASRALVWVTLALCFFTLVGSFLVVNQSSKLYAPKFDVQLLPSYYIIPHYSESFPLRIASTYWNDTSYKLPLTLKITNWGLVPVSVYYSVLVNNTCGNPSWATLVDANNTGDVVNSGGSFSSVDDLWLYFNNTIIESLPCELKFQVAISNKIINKKIVLLDE